MSAERVIITTPGDERLACCAWPDAGFEQCDPFESEPIYIVVPKNATDAAIDRVSKRFGLEPDELRAKRAEHWTEHDTVNQRLVEWIDSQ